MEIEIGKMYVNKTWRFLVPCLRDYGNSFVDKFNPLFKLAVGIHDSLFDNTDIEKGRNIFIMLNKNYQLNSFNLFKEWVKQQDYYVTDYCPDSNLQKSSKHIIVIKFPERYADAYDNFLQGRYSKMFSLEDSKNLFDKNETELKIVTKNSTLTSDFIKKVNEEFSVNLVISDFIGESPELELPPIREEEIFNCIKNNKVFCYRDFDNQVQTI